MVEQHVTINGIKFTPKEFIILQWLVRGLSRKQMAAQKGRSISTVNSQLSRIFDKLNIHKDNLVINWCLKNGFDDEGNYTPKDPHKAQAQDLLMEIQQQKEKDALPKKPRTKKKKVIKKKKNAKRSPRKKNRKRK